MTAIERRFAIAAELVRRVTEWVDRTSPDNPEFLLVTPDELRNLLSEAMERESMPVQAVSENQEDHHDRD